MSALIGMLMEMEEKGGAPRSLQFSAQSSSLKVGLPPGILLPEFSVVMNELASVHCEVGRVACDWAGLALMPLRLCVRRFLEKVFDLGAEVTSVVVKVVVKRIER